MASQPRSKYPKSNIPKLRKGAEKSGSGQSGLVLCNGCQAVYFKKHWHHDLLKLNLSESASLEKNSDKKVKFALCPACQMIKNRQFEGEVIIKNVPEKLKEEVMRFVRGFCLRAYQRDPMDRLIDIKVFGKDIAVTVTENELASKLGRKMKNLFNNTKVKISFDHKPSNAARVVVEFLSNK
ncbi:MAG: hypothetical protein Q8P76_02710 [bacterium]|nr:hypothetical protein [bacterium]